MTTTAARKIVLGVIPTLLAVGAVAGCNDSAPSVQAPPATGPTSTSSGVPTAPSDTTSSDGGVPTATAVPTNPNAPSSPTGDPAQVCTATSDGFLTPGAIGPKTKKAAWGKPLDLTQQYEGTVTMTAAVPTSKKPSGGNDVFGPPAGQVFLLVKVDVKYKSGDQSTLGDVYFTLRDTKNNICDTNSLGDAIPTQQKFDLSTISSTSKTYSGTLVFEVPAGQDYKSYTLLYRPDTFSDKSPDAAIAWTK